MISFSGCNNIGNMIWKKVQVNYIDEEYEEEEEELVPWYQNMEPLVNHVQDVKLDLTFILGTLYCIDEMMICFMEKSTENQKMKNRSIS